MTRVTGIGGIFFKARDAAALRAWYQRHLGIDVLDNDYYAPSKSTFMVNYRVADLTALLVALRAEGCNVMDKTDDSEYGKFGWVMDPEGNKVELWEPPPGQ